MHGHVPDINGVLILCPQYLVIYNKSTIPHYHLQ